MLFQSLFFWNSPSDSARANHPHPRHPDVSILVFLELAFGLGYSMDGQVVTSSVSILVFLELAFGLLLKAWSLAQ